MFAYQFDCDIQYQDIQYQKVRQARRELGLTQEALSSLLGITFQQIQKYEAGQSRLSAGRLRDVAIALNKPIDFFYEPFVIELPASGKAERDLKIMGLRRDGKRLIDRIENDQSLRAAIHILEALERSSQASVLVPRFVLQPVNQVQCLPGCQGIRIDVFQQASEPVASSGRRRRVCLLLFDTQRRRCKQRQGFGR